MGLNSLFNIPTFPHIYDTLIYNYTINTFHYGAGILLIFTSKHAAVNITFSFWVKLSGLFFSAIIVFNHTFPFWVKPGLYAQK